MNPIEAFKQEVKENIEGISKDQGLKDLTWEWVKQISPHRYTHNFTWLARPIIQFPQDIQAMQELIWQVRPNLIIETGIAHGGSLIFNASMLAMLEYQDAVENGTVLDPKVPSRKVLGIDIDIRAHNREMIEAHPMASRINMIQGSSIDQSVIEKVYQAAKNSSNILVILDSNHTHEHVMAELDAYAPLTSKGSYCIVYDTAVEDMPEHFFPDRPWGKGDNPKTAVWEYLKKLENEDVKASDGDSLNFRIDSTIENKILITVAPDGYLKRT